MPKNTNSCPVACAPPCQKKLLKIVSCLWKQYIVNRTSQTDAYFANPDDINYRLMVSELSSCQNLLRISPAINSLDASGNHINVAIITADAEAYIAYNSDDISGNTFLNASEQNLGTEANEKNIMKLNVDECLETVYQVRPAFDKNGVACTEVIISERTGCNGVSNTGFISLLVQVSLENYPFNYCSTGLCLYDTCNTNPNIPV